MTPLSRPPASLNRHPAADDYANLYFDLQRLPGILAMCQDCLGKTFRNRQDFEKPPRL
jgi:hypothetical protein